MLPWLQRTQNKTIPYATTKRAKDHTYKNATVHVDFFNINDKIPSSIGITKVFVSIEENTTYTTK